MVSQRPRGLFINPTKAQCSIYESGRMMYQALLHSDRYDLDYLEFDPAHPQLGTHYQFYLFNYHHATMGWLDTKCLKDLPAPKFTFVLEVAPGNPFALCPPDDFDAYLPLDPSLVHPDPRVFPMPRPLELAEGLLPYREPRIPVIGTFGFGTPGKGFELVVDAVGREFKEAIVRINVPQGTHADPYMFKLFGMPYADHLEALCRKVARPGIEVEFTRDYMDERDLIQWCGQNTLNCFLYNRDQPGLSATTDQAIAAARPLAVGTNPTFRHLHTYLKPYPFRSLREAIAESLPEVMQMRADWAPTSFAKRFEEMLATQGILAPQEREVGLCRPKPAPRKPILLVNHSEKQCGIHQYGLDIAAALGKSSHYEFIYIECSDAAELREAVQRVHPLAVLYNHYSWTMPWVTPALTRSLGIPQMGVMHEVTQEAADAADSSLFDAHFCPDPTLVDRNPLCHRIPRLIQTYMNVEPPPEVLSIGSFGFAFKDKGFVRLVEQVQAEFDRARIYLHVPENDLVPSDLISILQEIKAVVRKPGIEVLTNQRFFSKVELLDFLATKSLNVFLYDEHKKAGISSVVEKALAVQRPVAVSRSGMFRHVHGASPSITLGDHTLREILEAGTAPLVPFLNDWSEGAFIKGVEEVFDRILGQVSTAPSVPEQATPLRTVHSLKTLQTRKDVEVARTELCARGLSFTNPGQVVAGLGPIGDPLKSWDVLETVKFIEDRFPRNAAVLDIGAFSCEILPILHRMGFTSLSGIDLNPKIGLMPFADKVNYVEGNFHQTGFPDESFDAITAISVIEHGFEPENLLREVSRLLRPGGVFIASVDYWPTKIPTEGKEIFGLSWRIFSAKELQQFFKDAENWGLRVSGVTAYTAQEQTIHYDNRDYTFAWFWIEKPMKVQDRDHHTRYAPLVWMAPEDSASAIVALGSLPHLSELFPERPVVAICPNATQGLHRAFPGVWQVLAYDLQRAQEDSGYVEEFGRLIKDLRAGVMLSPGRAGQPVVERLASISEIPNRIGYGSNWTKCLPLDSPLAPESDRNLALLKSVGGKLKEFHSLAFCTPEEELKARELLRDHRLSPGNIVFLLAEAEQGIPTNLASALKGPLLVGGHQVAILHTPAGAALAAEWQTTLGAIVPMIESASFGVTYALLCRAKVAIGGEGPLSSLASAAGIRQLVIMGGGEFGRFHPSTSETVLACRPLACFGCGWDCPFPRRHCVKDLPDAVLQVAWSNCLEPTLDRPRIVVPNPAFGCSEGPHSLDLEPLLDHRVVKLVVASGPTQSGPENPPNGPVDQAVQGETLSELKGTSEKAEPNKNRRLTLVNPPGGFCDGLMPLGLASLSAYLKQHGYSHIRLLDGNCQDIYGLPAETEILGITAVTQTIRAAIDYAVFAKSQQPNVIIILGGVHVTTARELPEPFDIGVIGEGELTLLELMKLPNLSPNCLTNVKGICYRQNGELIFTEPRPLVDNLDEFPIPDRDLMNTEYYGSPRTLIPYNHGRTMSILSSRGCPFSCVFCSTKIQWKKFRAHSAERVVEEMELIVNKYNIEIIHLFDDLFTANKKGYSKFEI